MPAGVGGGTVWEGRGRQKQEQQQEQEQRGSRSREGAVRNLGKRYFDQQRVAHGLRREGSPG